MGGGMGPGRGGGHPFGGDETGPTRPVGAALPLLRRAGGLYASLAAMQFGVTKE